MAAIIWRNETRVIAVSAVPCDPLSRRWAGEGAEIEQGELNWMQLQGLGSLMQDQSIPNNDIQPDIIR